MNSKRIFSNNFDDTDLNTMNNGAVAGCCSSRKRSRIEESFSALSIDADMLDHNLRIDAYQNSTGESSLDSKSMNFGLMGGMSSNSDRMSTNTSSVYDATTNANGVNSSSQSNGMSMSDESSSVSDTSEVSGAIDSVSHQKELLYKLVFGNTYRSGKSRRFSYDTSTTNQYNVEDRIEQLIRSSRVKTESFHENGEMDFGENIIPPPPPPAASPVEPDSPRFSGEPSHSEFIMDNDNFQPRNSAVGADTQNSRLSSGSYDDWREKWSNTSLYSLGSDDGMDM